MYIYVDKELKNNKDFNKKSFKINKDINEYMEPKHKKSHSIKL